MSGENTCNISSEFHPLVETSAFSDLIEIDYIGINGDDELLQMAEDNGWPGSGYEWDPIKIEGYYFRNALHMFVVDNTELYWEFSNNVLDGIDDRYCEIVIGNLRNGKISNNYFTRGSVGIHTIRVHDCQFSGNVFYNQSWDGILLEYSYNNIIIGNEFIDEGEAGVLAWVDSYENNILYNEVYGSPYGFMFWDGSYGNMVQHNSIHDLSLRGLDIQTSNNIVRNNDIYDCESDAILILQPGTEIIENLIYNNGGYGVNLGSESGDAIIENNIIINCENGGIILHRSDNSQIRWNDFYDNSDFQAWDYGDNNIFSDNYWHEWVGNDTNSNDIIDEPKLINGGNNTDPRPRATPVNPIPDWYDFEPITGPPPESEPEPEPTTTITTTDSITTTTYTEIPTSTNTNSTTSTNDGGPIPVAGTASTNTSSTTSTNDGGLIPIATAAAAGVIAVVIVAFLIIRRRDI